MSYNWERLDPLAFFDYIISSGEALELFLKLLVYKPAVNEYRVFGCHIKM